MCILKTMKRGTKYERLIRQTQRRERCDDDDNDDSRLPSMKLPIQKDIHKINKIETGGMTGRPTNQQPQQRLGGCWNDRVFG